jgi:HEAT repeat protein
MSQSDEDQNIEHLISTFLSARTWQARVEATDALIRLGKPATIPLMDAISNARLGYHDLPQAVRALGRIRDERAVPLLIGILASDHVHAAQEAAEALGYIGDPRAILPLINTFRHHWDGEEKETITTWQEASRALAAIGEVAFAPLISALQDRNSTVRSGAIDALGQLKDTQAVDPLVRMLQDEDWQVRSDTAEALGNIGDQQAIEPLIALLTDEDGYVRQRACYALGDIGRIPVFEALISALRDSEPEVRCAAVVNLGRMLGMRIPGMDLDPESEIRHAAIEILKRTQGERVLDFLLEALNDPAAAVRAAAARTLGKIGDERVLPALLWVQQNDLSYDGANKVKDSAAWAIQRLKERYQKS